MQGRYEGREFSVGRLARFQYGTHDHHQDGGGLQGVYVGRFLKETTGPRDRERLLACGRVDAETAER
ncbi:hypothetical protein [Streptomyces tailanensis]|uniref:hypothetical protein n=1 Tax=Streptomyces tailanensis TaxID=2569858 RepID=UPI00155AFB78|nr:hypothetical protein [Streptomyces tailanensis]